MGYENQKSTTRQRLRGIHDSIYNHQMRKDEKCDGFKSVVIKLTHELLPGQKKMSELSDFEQKSYALSLINAIFKVAYIRVNNKKKKTEKISQNIYWFSDFLSKRGIPKHILSSIENDIERLVNYAAEKKDKDSGCTICKRKHRAAGQFDWGYFAYKNKSSFTHERMYNAEKKKECLKISKYSGYSLRVDQIKAGQGYHSDNIQLICNVCNCIKSNYEISNEQVKKISQGYYQKMDELFNDPNQYKHFDQYVRKPKKGTETRILSIKAGLADEFDHAKRKHHCRSKNDFISPLIELYHRLDEKGFRNYSSLKEALESLTPEIYSKITEIEKSKF